MIHPVSQIARPLAALALLALALVGGACRTQAPGGTARHAGTIEVELTLDYGPGAREPRRQHLRLAPGTSVLAATRAVADVRQAWVCCSDEDVFGIDGLDSDPARDGYWTWWQGDRLGDGFAHQVILRGGERLTWRYALADPAGIGADPVTRIAALTDAACAALEAIGARRNLVAHGETCGRAAHSGLPRLPPRAGGELLAAVAPDWVIAAEERAVPEGAQLFVLVPPLSRADWEALGELCGRRGAALVAWTARRLAVAP